MTSIDDRVALVLADAKSAEAVERTVAGSDAVVSALGHTKGASDDILPRDRDRERDRGHARGHNRQARRAVVAHRGKHG